MADSAKKQLSENGDRAILFLYILAKGLHDLQVLGVDERTKQLKAFEKISGLSEYEVLAAFAELEDAGMIEEG